MIAIDASGQLPGNSEQTGFVTFGAVAFEHSENGEMRDLLSTLPKWKNATGESLNKVLELLGTNEALVEIVHVTVEQPEWTRFWSAGQQFYRDRSKAAGRRFSRLKPHSVFKIGSFGLVLSGLVARMFVLGRGPRLVDSQSRGLVGLGFVFDRELQATDCLESLGEVLDSTLSPLTADFLAWSPRLRGWEMVDEEDDPYLVFPDYLAGLCRCARQGRGTTALSGDRCKIARESLRGRGFLVESTQPFSFQYPDE